MNFQKKNRKKEERNEVFTSQYFFNSEKNNNIFSRAWSILYGLTPNSNAYKFLLKYYFEKEKPFFNFIEEKYNSLDNLKKIDELIEYFKQRFFYYNKNSFLWMNLINKINIDNNLNKDDINNKLIEIGKEITNLTNIEKYEIDAQKINDDKLILIDIQKKLENKKNQIEIDEKYKKGGEELYKLKKKLKNLKV